MKINLLKSKIHRATVTTANLDYIGSISIEGYGGTEPYEYVWPTIGQFGPTAQNLNSGIFP